jgi:lipopolysaccharide export system protein LptA
MRHILLIALYFTAFSAEALAAAPKTSKHDTKQPIEINADELEVFQEENRAVFSGNVVAIQGKVRLKSDRMNVFYSSSDSDKKSPSAKPAAKSTTKAPAKQAANPAQGGIDRIEVTGNVFLSTPTETASGTQGEYDVKGQEVRLSGNVVLTRDRNTLKGDRLVYSFLTGKSLLTAGGTVQNGKKERVRALFVPEKKQPQ